MSKKLVETIESLEKELKCPVCGKVMKNPHSLPCNHNGCRDCMRLAIKDNCVCPICSIPAFHRAITKNPQMTNIISAFEKLKTIIINNSSTEFATASTETTPPKRKATEPDTAEKSLKKSKPTKPSLKTSEASSSGYLSDPSLNLDLINQKLAAHEKKLEELDELVNVIPSPLKPNTITTPNKSLGLRKDMSFAGLSQPSDKEEDKVEEVSKSPKKAKTTNSEPVSVQSPSKKKASGNSYVLLTTGLDSDTQQKQTKLLARKLGATIVNSYDSTVTHLITTVDKTQCAKRTLKYLFGILGGVWVISYEWVKKCLEENQWCDEEEFEVKGDNLGKGGPKLGRLRAMKKDKLLFEGYSFYLYGEFKPPSPSSVEIKNLLKMGGGEILKSAPKKEKNPKCLVLCDLNYINEQSPKPVMKKEFSCKTINVLWALDSIGNYSLAQTADYKVD